MKNFLCCTSVWKDSEICLLFLQLFFQLSTGLTMMHWQLKTDFATTRQDPGIFSCLADNIHTNVKPSFPIQCLLPSTEINNSTLVALDGILSSNSQRIIKLFSFCLQINVHIIVCMKDLRRTMSKLLMSTEFVP